MEVQKPLDDNARTSLFGGVAPADAPFYSMAAAARHLRIPASTVRWWVRGRDAKGYQPLLTTGASLLLSFNDLVELFVIRQLRRVHEITLQDIRRSIEFSRADGHGRVLLSSDLRVFGRIIVQVRENETIALSRGGQLFLRGMIEDSVRRIERDVKGLPILLHPAFDGEEPVGSDLPVSISPEHAFGQPTVTGTGLKTGVVAALFDAGESKEALAEGYDVPLPFISSALSYEYVR